jgi:hypothetical protein
MIRDDIIRMVEESGLDSILREWLHEFTLDSWVDAEIPELERFAALVAAAEREACAKVCEELPNTFKIAADEFGYTAEHPTAENYAAAIRTRDDT